MIAKSKTARGFGTLGIQRVDREKNHTHCWIVRMQRRRKRWRQSFSDGIYGGKINALRAARAFRDELLLSQPPMTRAEYASIKRRNNRSGAPGVCRYVATETIAGEPTERAYWIAFWTTEDGTRARRKFSVTKHGEKRAYERAKALRSRAIAALDGPYATSPRLKSWLRQHALS